MLNIDQKTIETAIVRDAVDKIIGDDEIYRSVRKGIEDRIDKLWCDQAKAQVEAAVDAAVKGAFDREYQRIDQFGRAAGDKTSIRAEVEKLIGNYWTEMVDSTGKPDKSTYGTRTTRAEWLMTKICADDFTAQMKQHVVNVAGGLKDGLRVELRNTLDKLLTSVFHVTSAGDQASKHASTVHPQVKAPGGAA